MNRHLEAVPTLPRLLAQAGYVSLQTGKWWQGNYSRGGFTHGMTKGERHGDVGLDIGRKTMQPIYDFIATAEHDKKPFFVWYAPMMPHQPHNPPQRILDKYARVAPSLQVAKYWGMVEWFDETVGDLLKHLDEQKLSDNTIVVFVTDNGWITDPKTGSYAPKSKQSQYDGGVRTPIMIRWPGHVKPSGRTPWHRRSISLRRCLRRRSFGRRLRCPASTYLISKATCRPEDNLRRVLHSRFNRTQQPGRQLALAMDDRRQLEADRSGST